MRKVSVHVQRRHSNEHAILDELAKIIPPGKPLVGASYPAFAERLGRSSSAMLTAKAALERAGVLRVTIANPPGQRGRVSTWELTMPVKEAHAALSREHERESEAPREIGRPAKVRPTAGAKRLVDEARRYQDRIDRGLRVDRDERLEAIVEVLPVIDALERERDSLSR
jgi:hypothetical protein